MISRLGSVLLLTTLTAVVAHAVDSTQPSASGCYDPTTKKWRVLPPGQKCNANEVVASVIDSRYTTPHAEAYGNNDWGGRVFRDGKTLTALRYLSAGVYGRSVSGLPDTATPVYSRIDLDDDGMDDLVWLDAAGRDLLVYYDFDDAEVDSKADAVIALEGTTFDLDAYEDKFGTDVLVLCNEKACADLTAVVPGDEPDELP